jgi:hypothetical protein
MRLVDYWCPECRKFKRDVYYEDVSKIKKTIPCDCGNKMLKLFGSQIFIDDWSPTTHDARRDIEHFAKKKMINGKYCDTQTMYREDRMKQDIPVNIQEI